MKKLIFPITVLVSIAYVGFCIFMYQQQDDLLYNPQIKKMDRLEAQAEAANLIQVKTPDGIELEGWYFLPTIKNKPTIVFFHGNGWNIGESFGNVKFLLSEGYGLLMVEYRGYAGHKGIVSEEGLYTDARTFIDWLHATRDIPYKDMIFYGESLGSAIATKMASEYKPAAAILVSGFSSMVDLAFYKYPYLPVSLLLKDQYRNDRAVKRFSSPVLILNGKKDHLVNFRFGQKLYKAANEPKEIKTYDDGTHTNLYTVGGHEDIIDFLNNLKTTDE